MTAGSTTVIVCSDGRAIAARSLDLLVDGLRTAILQRGEAHLALTGGSSIAPLFDLLCTDARARRVDWTKVHVWQGDERFVPLGHPDSNWAGALRDWLDHADGPPIPADHRHPMPVEAAITGGHDAAWAASRYAAEIERSLPRRAGLPAFDVVLLGVGNDGHILSAFPGGEALTDEAPVVMAVPAPQHIEPRVPRITLAPRLLMAAGLIVLMVPGAAKRDAVRLCLGPRLDREHVPAQWALRPNAVWLLDAASATSAATATR